ncbi:MAG: hypothetical protein J5I47_06980 [Vicingus serpentipes]|nr:hypothetical protein [Vicingus serpentipes]
MKTLSLLITLSSFCNLFSQNNINHDSLINFSENVAFIHFTDKLITKEYTNRNKETILDTVYSCNYNANKKIESERFYKYDSRVDLIRYYTYDTLNREVFQTEFYAPYYDSLNVTKIGYSQSYYNLFDSLSHTENYGGSRIRNPPLIEEKDGYVSHSFSTGYSSNWEWCKQSIWRKHYDTSKRLIQVNNLTSEADKLPCGGINVLDCSTSYKYDTLNRKIRESFIEYSMNGSCHHSNEFEYNYELFYHYDSNMVIITNSSPYWNPFSQKIIYYDNQGKIKKEDVITVSDYSDTDNSKVTTEYFYDKFSRLLKKIEQRNDSQNKTIYRYYYNK